MKKVMGIPGVLIVFAAGLLLGVVVAAGKNVTDADWRGLAPEEAAGNLLAVARNLAGGGSWENIAVGRVHYLAGRKSEGEAIFATYLGERADPSDLIRIGRIYLEAGEWDKARPVLDQAVNARKANSKWFAEVGAYYHLQGDMEKAEELYARSFAASSKSMWDILKVAAGYEGLRPQTD